MAMRKSFGQAARNRSMPFETKPARVTSVRPKMRMKPLAAAVLQVLATGILLAETQFLNAAPALPLPQPEAVLASMGVASYSINGAKGIIDQKSDRAILNWKSFDIGKDNSVEFRQPSSTSIALNRINERINPSQILGTLTANGQVYLYNPNGFVFGENARVDVNSLVASTLNVTDGVFEKGITNAINSSEPAFVGNGEVYLRKEDGSFQLDSSGKRIKIAVNIEAGAVINTNASNGRILVLAPSIVNGGALNAQEGQIIVAAATDKVYLQAADATATGIRGLLVEVSTGGDVTNLGKITANKGNVTLAGFAVNQNGLVSATTSVDLNGSIVLKAAEAAAVEIDGVSGAIKLKAQATGRAQAQDDNLGTIGTVTLGQGSITQVLPDADTGTAVDEQKQDPSRIDILGKFVRLQNAARIKAPGGKVAITATEQPDNPASVTAFAADTGIEIAAGSSIDVAGSSASASVARNVVEVQLLSNELRDAPEQKSGPLFGEKIRVDLRAGTPLADISGATARIARGIEERTAAGGSITLSSSGALRVEKNSLLDVSGGVLNYLADYVQTSKLLGADGKIYDISAADPQRQYIRILGDISKNYVKWNITKTWSLAPLFAKGRYEQGYVEGKAGGRLTINAPSISLLGELRGNTVDGARQREASERAAGASLLIDQARFTTGQDMVIADRDTAALLADLKSTLALVDTQLAKSGFRNITLQSNREQAVDIATGATLTLARGAALTINSGHSEIGGVIDSAGGSVTVATGTGDLSLTAGAGIDVRGEWINDSRSPPLAPLNTDGGAVSLSAHGKLALANNSSIDVSGGAWLHSDGKLAAGKGGRINLRADGDTPSALELNGRLTGTGIKTGGTLAVTANRVELTASALQPAGDPAALLLAPDFFQSGGFGNYVITAQRDGLRVREGAVIQPRAQNFILRDGYQWTPSGRGLNALAGTDWLPATERGAANLTLAVNHTGIGADPAASLQTAKDSAIVVEVGGTVKLRSDSDLLLSGAIVAPAGTIDLHIAPPPSKDLAGVDIADAGYRANQGIWLDSSALLSATGVALYTPNTAEIKTGSVRAGGIVSLTADRGYIVLQENSRIDVSGAAGVYSQANVGPKGIGTVYTDVARGSDGGRIQLTAADGAVLNGNLLAHGGNAEGAGGGTLALTLTTQNRNAAQNALSPYPLAPAVIQLSANTAPDSSVAFAGDLPLAGYGVARLAATKIAAGGFAALDLAVEALEGNNIRFNDVVNLSVDKRIALDTPSIVLDTPSIEFGAAATLHAAYVALGSTTTRTAAAPQHGTGTLTVAADLIDLVGGLGVSGIKSLDLISDGDIRLRGIGKVASSDLTGQLLTNADIRLHADQIYPTTFSQYTISLLDNASGTLTIEPNKAPHAVLSAAGKLTLNAPNIIQSGVVKAPFGTLEFNAAENLTLTGGSITSVSAEGQTIPFGKTLAGLQWIYDLVVNAAGGNRPIQTAVPEKRIALNGKSILFENNANLDVSGGGDLQAYEFIKGPGGSADVLDPTDAAYNAATPYTEKYALLPALHGEFAPYDYTEFTQSGLQVGASIYLSGSKDLAAGTYVLLPAHYALLPGAYLLTPKSGMAVQAGKISVAPNAASHTLNGAAVVSGYRLSAGTQIRDSGWSNFIVESGSVAKTRSQYALNLAGEFFPEKAATAQTNAFNLPADAGTVAVAAQTELVLQGRINGAAGSDKSGVTGRRGQLDIVADDIAIVAQREQVAQQDNRVALLDTDLNALDVGSIFIGGTRSRTSDGLAANTDLNIGAQTLEMFAGATLTAPELLLAAKQSVIIASGATLAAQGNTETGTDRLTVTDDAALLRVSSAPQVQIKHTGTINGSAQLVVANGAILRTRSNAAAGSINIDTTGAGTFAGSLDMRGGALQIGAERIALGIDSALAPSGIVLSNALLNSLPVDQLALYSRSQIDLLGTLDLKLKQLDIQAAGFNGGVGSAAIQADKVTLANPNAAHGSFNVTAASRLSIDSEQLTLGTGDFSLQGFSAGELSARQGLTFSGAGSLLSGSTTTLRAPLLSSSAGANYRIAAKQGSSYYDVNLLPLAATNTTIGGEFGGRLRIDAKNIALGSAADAGSIAILLPAGVVALNAYGGDITLAANAAIDVAGRQVLFADKLAFSGGGNVLASTDGGNIIAAPGSRIDVSAAAGGDAGNLSLSAPSGNVQLNGRLAAHANAAYVGGGFALDIGSLGDRSLAQLNDLLRAAGFNNEISLRQRLGDLAVEAGTEIQAHAIKLIADLGHLRIDGVVDASGANAGSVTLAAGSGVALTSNARVLARAAADNEKGGTVLIDSAGGVGASGGGIDLQTGSLIDVRGGAVLEKTETSATGSLLYAIDGARVTVAGKIYRGGEIVVRAPRTGTGLLAALNGSAVGAEQIAAEAVRIYDLGSNGIIDAPKITTYKNDTASFMSGALALGNNAALTPGIELRAANSLTLNALWDLANWRYGAGVGTLTLRSGGDLNIKANLTDAFKAAQTLQLPDGGGGTFALTLAANALQEGLSWSYRLIGGSDINSADVLAKGRAGNVALSNGAFVRTGTGAIAVAAAGNLTLADDRSALYTAGRKLAASTVLDRDNPYGTLGLLVGSRQRGFYAEFPVDGGDIDIDVGGDVIGATGTVLNAQVSTHQFITDWWVKESSNAGYTGWGIALDLPNTLLTTTATSATGGGRLDRISNARSGFRQNIGALGGGDIDIKAGGKLTDLSVVIPTTGKPIGQRDANTPINNPSYLSRDILVNGGGNLTMTAGGDIAGGLIFVGAGSATIRADGEIRGGTQYTAGPVFALGNTALKARANGDLNIGAIFDPGLLTSVYAVQPATYFLTYGDRSAVELTAVGGDIVLHNDTGSLVANAIRYFSQPNSTPLQYLTDAGVLRFLSLYPSHLTAQALSGDIDILQRFTLTPNATGTLNLLAANTIQSGWVLASGEIASVNLSDADIAKFPNVFAPGSVTNKTGLLEVYDSVTGLSHAPSPVHARDAEPARIIALNGDIRANDALLFGLSKQSIIAAGRDILNVSFEVQNINSGDVTTIQAGRDIRYSIDFNTDTGALLSSDQSLFSSGPGRFDFIAGRDIDLGASNGIASVGNSRNSALPTEGASLGIYAGINDANYSGFAQKYLAGDGDLYAKNLIDYVNAITGSQTTSKQAALAAFENLSPAQQRKLLVDVFFSELRSAGVDSAEKKDRSFLQRGLDAIEMLFPAASYRGDLKLLLSKINTVAGGDIDILVPGGLANAGLASSVLQAKQPSELGIVAQSAGDINVFVKEGLQVNQSRVFALHGGDITIWSTDGDIDAGRGSKAALSAPPPIITFDSNGNLKVTYPPEVSGSGIRTAAPPGETRGNVYLFTVNGKINTGEAGIYGKDIYIVGPVINAGGGLGFDTAVGAPTASVSLAPSLAAVSNQDAGAAQSATEQRAMQQTRIAAPLASLLTAQLVGFGDYSLGAIRDGNFSVGDDVQDVPLPADNAAPPAASGKRKNKP
jgi:filamentous hemagglutinin